MNRLLLLLLFVFSSIFAQSQMGYLFVKKAGKKKRVYIEGERITLQLKNDSIYNGLISQLRNDTIFLNGWPVPRKSVKAVILPVKPKKHIRLSTKDYLQITAGAALVTAGLTLSEQARFGEALAAGLVIGFSPVVVSYLKNKVTSIRRKKYRIGKKFYLQVLEFHLPGQRPF